MRFGTRNVLTVLGELVAVGCASIGRVRRIAMTWRSSVATINILNNKLSHDIVNQPWFALSDAYGCAPFVAQRRIKMFPPSEKRGRIA